MIPVREEESLKEEGISSLRNRGNEANRERCITLSQSYSHEAWNDLEGYLALQSKVLAYTP